MAKDTATMLNFYRVVLNQSLFDMKKVVDSLGTINNDLLSPQCHETKMKTINTLVGTYLNVCQNVKQLEELQDDKN